MEYPIEKALALKETKAFLEAAREYCAFIESTDKADNEFWIALQGLLLTLYQQGTTLPRTTLEHDEEFNDKLSKEEFEKILTRISEKVGDSRFYWEVFDPTNERDTQPGCGDLVDDLGDIYRDLKDGLMIFDLGTMASRDEALWDFNFGFEHHWGYHGINALRTIHYILHK